MSEYTIGEPVCEEVGLAGDGFTANTSRTVGIAQDDMPEPILAELRPKGANVSGQLVLSPATPAKSARAFVDQRYKMNGFPTLWHYMSVFYGWQEGRYVHLENGHLRAEVYPFLESSQRYNKDRETVPFHPTSHLVNCVVDAIRALTFMPRMASPPMWLVKDPNLPPPLDLLPCKSGILNLANGTLIPLTPKLFTTTMVPVEYMPATPPPQRWLAFLNQLWPNDPQSIKALQMWFGYCLTADTRQQKMLLLVGPKRSGKGTIARILTELLADNVVSPTTSNLAGQFGLQPLMGKTLAIIGDARFAVHSGTSVAVERLLCISGEDAVTIPRKFLGDVTVKLPTRFMFMSNELPRLADTSGALTSRFIILRLKTSFYGKEDTKLTETLAAELPGILNWAVEGWRLLQQEGRFTQPESADDLCRDLEDLGSPVGSFVGDCCDLGPTYSATPIELFRAWSNWCLDHDNGLPGTQAVFGRNLRAAVPSLDEYRPRDEGGKRPRHYTGIRLKPKPGPGGPRTEAL